MQDIMQKLTQDEDWKREFQYVVFARRRPIFATGAVVLAGSVLIALFWPQRFEASSSLLVRGKRAEISPATLNPVELRNLEISEQDVISEMEILRSPELARRVVSHLKAQGAWETESAGTGGRLPERVKLAARNVSRAARARLERFGITAADPGMKEDFRHFLVRLEVTRLPMSNVIRLRFAAQTPQAAESGLETLLDKYVPYRAEVLNPVGQEAFFAARMDHYRAQLDALAQRVENEGGETSPAVIDMKAKGNLDRLAVMQQQLGLLEMELAASAYLDNQPLQNRITLQKEAITQLEKENRTIQRQRIAAEAAFREAQLISHSFDTFAQRAEEARINDSIAQSNLAGDIRILSRAQGTGDLVFPRKGFTLLMGLLVALIAGVSVGFLAEFFDHSIRRPEDITRYAGLEVICSIPKV